MGGCFSFGISCDETLRYAFRWLWSEGYIRNLEDNLTDLRRQMIDLKATKDEVKNKVEMEERQDRQRCRPTVQDWLTRVEDVHTRFNNLDSTSTAQLENLCLCGLCAKNVCLSYKYGKSVFLLLEEVKKLKLEGDFKEVTEPTLEPQRQDRAIWLKIGQEEMLETAWNRLMEDGVGIMGLHGIGGVGKTTLFWKIHNKFVELSGKFDVVIWIVVSQVANISKLQEDIAQKLHLCGDEWKNKNESDKATQMHRVLKGKRFVLMLDDIWEKVDLEAIGIPEPTRESGCKVTFTTRSKDVCGMMGDHEPMQVKCLDSNQAWELFKSKVGDNTLRRDLNIVELAREIAKKCHGLPLALNLIGGTMASKTTVEEWEDAVYELTTSAAKFPDMENKILPMLKYSYDSLVDEQIRSCFLYCALFPGYGQIDKEKLIEYWICEGFIGEYQVLKRAINKGYGVLGTLIRANLLTDTVVTVEMHDVIREMALWIASDFGKQKESFVVHAGVGLHEVPKVRDWGAVRRMSLMDNKIEEITCGSKCCELTTLFLQNNKLKNISGEFIRSMQKLVVLDLSFNFRVNELPEQISEMTSLQYLDLTSTGIEQLPVGFQQLKKLTHLELSFTKRLRSISGISKLSSLRILRLLSSNVYGDVSLLEELQLLEHLQVLSIGISMESGLEKILSDQRLANCIDTLELTGNHQLKRIKIWLLVSMKNLKSLCLENIHVVETDTNKKCRESKRNSSDLHNPTIPCFTNLSTVEIVDCDSVKDLTWLLFAPNLASLYVRDSEKVEEIINKEKATKLTGVITPFQKLEVLWLFRLPKLESIYWSPLPFPILKRIEKKRCPNLRKLPLNSTSVSRVDELSIELYRTEHDTELEWEDEDTKNRFLPSIRLV